MLLYIFPFIWECFFGKKLPKDDAKEKEGNKDEENPAVAFLRKLLHKIQTDSRFAMGSLIILGVSLFFNYHLIGRVLVLSREAPPKPEVDVPPIVQPAEQSAYYDHLVDHLNKTYNTGK